jgi:hypothetical protein
LLWLACAALVQQTETLLSANQVLAGSNIETAQNLIFKRPYYVSCNISNSEIFIKPLHQ